MSPADSMYPTTLSLWDKKNQISRYTVFTTINDIRLKLHNGGYWYGSVTYTTILF